MQGKSIIDEYARNARAETEKAKQPMRDYRGRFIKGHAPLTRPTYDLMKKYPKLLCATCYARHKCIQYQNESVCAYKREFKKYYTRDVNDVVSILRSNVEVSLSEMQFAMIQETVSGTFSHDLSKLINKNARQLLLLQQLYAQIDNSKT